VPNKNLKTTIMENIIDIEQAKETHNKLREILIKYGNEEYGDCIVDEISWLFGFPTTIDVEPEEEEKEIPITYGLIKATCGWSKWCDVTNGNHYAINEFGDYEDREVFYITETQAKQLKFI
jgi:hypothetical protein